MSSCIVTEFPLLYIVFIYFVPSVYRCSFHYKIKVSDRMRKHIKSKASNKFANTMTTVYNYYCLFENIDEKNYYTSSEDIFALYLISAELLLRASVILIDDSTVL